MKRERKQKQAEQSTSSSEETLSKRKCETGPTNQLTSSENQPPRIAPSTTAFPLLPQKQHHQHLTSQLHVPTPVDAPMSYAEASSGSPSSSSSSSSTTQPKSSGTFSENPLNPSTQNQPSSLQSSKQLAIIIPAHNELTLVDYLDEISKIIPPADILYAAKISNNRMCFYLSSLALVDKIVETKEINTKVGSLLIRRLVNPAFRLVLSNVLPKISDTYLISGLSEYVNIVSPVQTLSAGLKNPKYAHIKSLRREVYVVKKPDSPTLPKSFLIPHEGEDVRIFLSIEDYRCFNCMTTQHKTNDCVQYSGDMKNAKSSKIADRLIKAKTPPKPDLMLGNQPKAPNPVPPPNDSEVMDFAESTPPLPAAQNCQSESPLTGTAVSSSLNVQDLHNKNTLSIEDSPKCIEPAETSVAAASPLDDHLPSKKEKKKALKLKKESNEILEAVKISLEEQVFPFTETEVVTMLSETKNSKKPIEIIQTHTSNTSELADLLKQVSSRLSSKNVKARIDRLVRTLDTELNSSDDSDNSLSSSISSKI